jgi:hypothetical protein
MKILKAKPLLPRYIKDSDKDVWTLDPTDDYNTYSLVDLTSPNGVVEEGNYRYKQRWQIQDSWSIIEESYHLPLDGNNI